MRAIDGDALNTSIALYVAENAYLNDTALDVLKMVAKWLEEQPTIEAGSVRHGQWVMTIYTTISRRGRVISNKKFACSECGYSNGRKQAHYCPNCGAIMDGDGNGT